MIIAICILSYLLLATIVILILSGIDNGWCDDEWFGILFAILFLPVSLTIVSIREIKRKLYLKKALKEFEEEEADCDSLGN